MWTAGMIMPIWDYENKGGIVQEIVDGINEMGMNSCNASLYNFDIEAMKLLLDRKLVGRGNIIVPYIFCQCNSGKWRR